ncbi:MAG: hypothetical protein Q7R40_15285 [Phaeospirillum sp.]|nr:hypothetical protein [Phaeospirillum sp.]
MKTPPPEPSIKSYFFGKGYRDLGATIRDSWALNWDTACDYGNRASQAMALDLPGKLLTALWAAAAIAVVVFGTAFFLVLSMIHIVILGLFFFTIYVLFSLAWVMDRGFLLIRGFFAVCPECHARVPLPAYACDSCGALHYRLSPSKFGILNHRCKCGQRLPATFFTNRGRLISKCPECSHSLSREHSESRKTFIPIIGGPSAGKSAYMAWLVRELRDVHGPAGGLSMTFLEEPVRLQVEAMIEGVDKGMMPSKTVAAVPHAINLLFSAGKRAHRTLYLYDPAGENFQASSELIPHQFLDYMTGIIFMIDPFSIPRVKQIYAPQLSGHSAQVNPSQLMPEDALNSLLLAMEAHFGVGKTARLKVPLSVVLSKIDAFDLDRMVGEQALAGQAFANSEAKAAAQSCLIEKQLRDWGQGNIVQTIESRFERVRYYSCSAVGLGHQTGRYQPVRIDDPFLWLLALGDRKFFNK